jgi:hypothetical protein
MKIRNRSDRNSLRAAVSAGATMLVVLTSLATGAVAGGPGQGLDYTPAPDGAVACIGAEAASAPGARAPSAVAADDGGAWEVGVEHSAWNLDAQASSEGNGLYNKLASCGWNKRYNFGNSTAWEEDFKGAGKPGGGKENIYLDTVDLAFYVGHGGPGGFTFANAAHDDSTLTPSDCNREWGNGDNEWVALTSCQVLADSSLSNWAGCFNGTHLILGFKTNASAQMGDDTQGYNFAKYLCQGYTVPQAWYKAADRSQPTGRVVRALINELAYLNDRPMCGSSSCPLAADSYDTDAWVQTHTAGSEPARPLNVDALGGSMPVFRTPPLSLDQAITRYNGLGVAFGVPVTVPRVLASLAPVASVDDLWTSTTNGLELELDRTSGQYGYTDLNTIWTDQTVQRNPAATVAIGPDEARRYADTFLNDNGLMPPDAQFYEVISDTISGGPIAANAASVGPDAMLADEQAVVWQVIYSRIISYTRPVIGNGPSETFDFSIIGPGAKQKVYVNTTVPPAALQSSKAVAAGVIPSAIGGWRALDQTAGRGPQAVEEVPIISTAQVYTLHQELEDRVVINTPPIDADGRQILSSTVAYWEEPAGTSQGELIPVYALSVRYTQGGQFVTDDYAYIPASPQYMRPYAAIQTTQQSPVRVSQMLTLTAVDANQTLDALGYGPGLNFIMGSGDYVYEWYLNVADDAHKIGSGRTIQYTVSPDVVSHEGTLAQNIILKVTDLTATNQQSARAILNLGVMQRAMIPVIFRH